ncbi:hypothetical protein [Cytobacillus purgationiresistens]|uniref:Uncharacterized protein n=1 Tax=Cytobacillus purgationiresistens TaxID=863449 RepID=A0ABU0AFT6_9BACI|nr:hypothetical protein [Cytobacillus purgationiresistens]MDQ0270119.1 hypothetical protein [Cytobacillus purgationiresistens]
MSEKVERVLVQGTVRFEVNCNYLKGLVTPDIANNPHRLKEWLENKAFKMIDISDVDVEIDYDREVLISEEIAKKHSGEIINNDDWKKISDEDKQKL